MPKAFIFKFQEKQQRGGVLNGVKLPKVLRPEKICDLYGWTTSGNQRSDIASQCLLLKKFDRSVKTCLSLDLLAASSILTKTSGFFQVQLLAPFVSGENNPSKLRFVWSHTRSPIHKILSTRHDKPLFHCQPNFGLVTAINNKPIIPLHVQAT